MAIKPSGFLRLWMTVSKSPLLSPRGSDTRSKTPTIIQSKTEVSLDVASEQKLLLQTRDCWDSCPRDCCCQDAAGLICTPQLHSLARNTWVASTRAASTALQEPTRSCNQAEELPAHSRITSESITKTPSNGLMDKVNQNMELLNEEP